MANQTYRPLFQIEVFHTYFESGTAENSLQLIPSDTTSTLFNTYGFRLHSKKGIFTVFGSYEGAFLDLLNEITATSDINYFDFNLDSNDPSFYGYTELPVNEKNTYLYDSDSNSNLETPEGIILAPTQIPFTTHFGNVRIYFEDIIESIQEIPSFNIQFNARATRWDYFIINSSDINFNTLSIETNEGFLFLGPEQVTIANGQVALKLTSDPRLLPLSEFPKYTFNLITITNGNKKNVIRGLPQPSPEHLYPYQENGITKASSPMYIYI